MICILLVTCKLWLVGPHELVAMNMPHDDLLFVTLAQHILQGKWLGDYNQLTLIKGPFYPLFIAGSYLMDVPLLAAQQLLYAFACVVFTWAIFPVVRYRWLLLMIFVFLLLNPFSYDYPPIGRVFRLGIYQSLGLLVFSSLLGLYLRLRVSVKATAGWAILTGFSLSAFWHTREESIWIVPSLLFLCAMAMYAQRVESRSCKVWRLAFFLVPVLIWAGATFTLRMLNYSHYGIFATIELETPEFKSAYGGLLRIKSEQWRRFYPVVNDVREQAYSVSPTFSELKPYLEGALGKRWTTFGNSKRSNIPAAFFVWAFRDAVAYAGYYKNGPDTMQFYQRMGQEIDAACESGKLDCRPRISSLIPAWHSEYNKLFFPTFFSVFKRIILFQDFSADTRGLMSKGTAKLMQLYDIVTREKLRTSRKDVLHSYPEYHLHLNHEKVRVLSDIGSFYQHVVPVLFVVSCLCLLLFFLIPAMRRRISCYVIFSLSFLGGLCSITFILTLIVITSYTSINRAMHVGYPLVLLTIVCMILAGHEYFQSSVRGEGL